MTKLYTLTLTEAERDALKFAAEMLKSRAFFSQTQSNLDAAIYKLDTATETLADDRAETETTQP